MKETIDTKKACGYCVYGATFTKDSKCKRYLQYMESGKRKEGGTMMLAQRCKKFYSSQLV